MIFEKMGIALHIMSHGARSRIAILQLGRRFVVGISLQVDAELECLPPVLPRLI